MFTRYRTQGLILKKIDRGEADQLFTIYTKDFGKLEILGKAIRKAKSKLRSGMELFYLSEIEFIQGKTYKTLTDAILIEKFGNLRKDLKRLAISYRISEVLNNLVRIQEPDKKIWQLLNETFQKLNTYNLKPKTYNLIYYYFLWNLLSVLGYQPELYNCSFCQKNLSTEAHKKFMCSVLDRAQNYLCSGIIPDKIYFSPNEGGIICPICFKKNKQKNAFKIGSYQEIDSDIVKILRIILKKDWDILFRLNIESSYQKKLNIISKDFLSVIPHFENF